MPVESQATIEPHCLATMLGSVPHTDVARGTALMFEYTPEIPSWVQFPRRAFEEHMMVRIFAPSLRLCVPARVMGKSLALGKGCQSENR